MLNDLPWAEVSLVGVGPDEVEVTLVEAGLGEELAAAAKGFQVVELVRDEPMDGFDVALVGVGRRGNALVLGAEAGDGAGEAGAGAIGLGGADEFAAVVGWPDEVG